MGLRYVDGEEPPVVLEATWAARANPVLQGRLLVLPDGETVETLLGALGLAAR
jgi:hypothetical protein